MARIAAYVAAQGYKRIPGKARQYLSPSGQVVSRRQAEQRSGALRSLLDVGSREELAERNAYGGFGIRESREYYLSLWEDHDLPWRVRREAYLNLHPSWGWDEAKHEFIYA